MGFISLQLEIIVGIPCCAPEEKQDRKMEENIR